MENNVETKNENITPLRTLRVNAQSASPRSLITAHEVGVLNVQRCNSFIGDGCP